MSENSCVLIENLYLRIQSATVSVIASCHFYWMINDHDQWRYIAKFGNNEFESVTSYAIIKQLKNKTTALELQVGNGKIYYHYHILSLSSLSLLLVFVFLCSLSSIITTCKQRWLNRNINRSNLPHQPLNILGWCWGWEEGGIGVSEWLNLTAFLGTADSEVHIIYISRVDVAHTLESLSSLT